MTTPRPPFVGVVESPHYVTIHRIGGDIYINGQKKAFAVDFNNADPSRNELCENVDWLLGWAKIGLMSRGHTVPHFEPSITSNTGGNSSTPVPEGKQ